jgi:hypothetical protein
MGRRPPCIAASAAATRLEAPTSAACSRVLLQAPLSLLRRSFTSRHPIRVPARHVPSPPPHPLITYDSPGPRRR